MDVIVVEERGAGHTRWFGRNRAISSTRRRLAQGAGVAARYAAPMPSLRPLALAAILVLAGSVPARADVPAAGMTVQFHFVVRDGRGGLGWAHRALCVVAP